MIYLGFDLGDGESCITWSHNALEHSISTAPVSGHDSYISAVGRLDGELVVGYDAKHPEAEDVHVCFKRHFLEHDPESEHILKDFVKGTLRELRKNPQVGDIVDDPEQACFIVGCPAGWNRDERGRYRDLLKRAGMKNVKVVSESRAAFENAVHDPANALDPEVLKGSVLVIDIGSSTLDFAYVYQGNEFDVSTMGNVLLGGGLMDEMIVLRAVEDLRKTSSEEAERTEKIINGSDSQKSRLMMIARELKEDYFNNEDFYLSSNETLSRTARIYGGGEMLKLNLAVSPDIVENWLISRPHPLLNGQSFENRIRDSLIYAYNQTLEKEAPSVVILTGGPSRMRFFRELCRRQFPGARMIFSEEPEYDISRGLVYLGSIDEKVACWIEDVRQYIDGDSVEKIISGEIPGLVEDISGPMTELVMRSCVLPEFADWKKGSVSTLKEFETRTRERIADYMTSPAMQAALEEKITVWSREIMKKVGDDIREISRKNRLDIRFSEDGLIRVVGGETDRVQVPVAFVDVFGTIVSAVLVTVTGLLCGGGGIALIAEGIAGIAIGVLIAAVAIAAGGAAAKELIMRMEVPMVFRKLVRSDAISSEKNMAKVKASIREGMLADKKLETDLTEQVSEKIEKAIFDAAASLEEVIAS